MLKWDAVRRTYHSLLLYDRLLPLLVHLYLAGYNLLRLLLGFGLQLLDLLLLHHQLLLLLWRELLYHARLAALANLHLLNKQQ